MSRLYLVRHAESVWNREGIVQGETFYGPALNVQIGLPRGWAMAHGDRAMQAMHPEQDALLLLGELEEPSAASARQTFLSSPGVRAEPAPAGVRPPPGGSVAGFVMRTDAGALRGLVAFGEDGGRTYAIIAAAVLERWPNRQEELTTAMASVGPITRPEIAQIEPVRVHVERLAEDTSIREIAVRCACDVTVEDVALLNGVEPEAHLPAGERSKVLR